MNPSSRQRDFWFLRTTAINLSLRHDSPVDASVCW